MLWGKSVSVAFQKISSNRQSKNDTANGDFYSCWSSSRASYRELDYFCWKASLRNNSVVFFYEPNKEYWKCTQIPLPRANFQRSGFQAQLWRTAPTPSTFTVEGRTVKIVPSRHRCWFAWPECNGNYIHDLTIMWLFISHFFLRVNSTMFGGMTIPQSNTGYETNSEMIAGEIGLVIYW